MYYDRNRVAFFDEREQIYMEVKSVNRKNYKYTDYIFEKTTVRYVNIEGRVFMLLIPNGTEDKINDDYFEKKIDDDGSEDLCYHVFKGGWATEGKHISRTLP